MPVEFAKSIQKLKPDAVTILHISTEDGWSTPINLIKNNDRVDTLQTKFENYYQVKDKLHINNDRLYYEEKIVPSQLLRE